jgi:septum formation protein
MTVSFVLASKSPARLSTLQAAGIYPRVIVSDVDEDRVLANARRDHLAAGLGDLDPADAVLALARAKAVEVSEANGTDAIVLGCDSMLEFEGEILGKPHSPDVARDRWRSMRGKSGTLHSVHWLCDDRDDGSNGTVGATSSTVVHFANLTDAEIDEYVATGEPLQVAGAFTVDGIGGPYVTAIEGDYHGVVGVSLPLLRELLGELGVAIHELRSP